MALTLLRISTEFSAHEDRFLLSGEVEGALPVRLWLTRRLLQRLVPTLVRWLEEQLGDIGLAADVVHGFAQQVAKAELERQAPVRAASRSVEWLVGSVDVGTSARAIQLGFRGKGEQNALLTMEPRVLRQWLHIVYATYVKAEWPLDVWPDWLREGASATVRPAAVLH